MGMMAGKSDSEWGDYTNHPAVATAIRILLLFVVMRDGDHHTPKPAEVEPEVRVPVVAGGRSGAVCA
jgi:hypothetical protein